VLTFGSGTWLPGLVKRDLTMKKIDREQVAADWAKRGFGCDLWTDPPGWRWEDFTRGTDELVVVLEGEIEFEIAGEVCQPAIGDELLIPAGKIHSARNIGASTSPLALWVQVMKDVTDHSEAGDDSLLRNGTAWLTLTLSEDSAEHQRCGSTY
jgi:mannose-6-phosphate isomerase-like protein (cupin superfamily)